MGGCADEHFIDRHGAGTENRRGLAPEQIADMLEINLAIVKEICNVAKDYAPDYDVKKISEVYQKESLCPTAK